jgi:RNA polymerase sigma-70 factor (ECF subfamily)
VRAVKLEGRSIADVSAATGLSPSAVKVKIHRAIKTLRRNM